jgi:hypothetical protein
MVGFLVYYHSKKQGLLQRMVFCCLKMESELLGKQTECSLLTKTKTFGVKLKEVVDIMCSVETDSLEAKLNEISISDNNGGRILL